MRMLRALVTVTFAVGLFACERNAVNVELPRSGRALSSLEQSELQRIAEETFREVRPRIEGLPARLTLIVRWGKDVIPETGENGAAGFPGNIGWTLDPDRDALSTIRSQLHATLVHELVHLARASRVSAHMLMDRVVDEGLATAFERDVANVDPPWGKAPPEITDWLREIRRQPDDAEQASWIIRHPDGRRWIGMRVGTFLVDRACRASGKTPADFVFTPTAEIVKLGELGARP